MSRRRRGRSNPPRKAERQREAIDRQEAYDKLPAAHKVALAGRRQLDRWVARGKEPFSQLATARLDELDQKETENDVA